MKISGIPFGTTDWSGVPVKEVRGESGTGKRRELTFGEINVSMVDYSPGYVADHWCQKGHILLCLEGELITEMKDGRRVTLKAGQSYQVEDGATTHRSRTETGARIFIVD